MFWRSVVLKTACWPDVQGLASVSEVYGSVGGDVYSECTVDHCTVTVPCMSDCVGERIQMADLAMG